MLTNVHAILGRRLRVLVPRPGDQVEVRTWDAATWVLASVLTVTPTAAGLAVQVEEPAGSCRTLASGSWRWPVGTSS